jgi:putative ABC transport system permease protein
MTLILAACGGAEYVGAVTGDVSPVGLAASGVLVVVAVVISTAMGLHLERRILWASLRAVVQLLAVGVVLGIILDPGASILWSFVWVAAMILFAGDVVGRRVPEMPHARLIGIGAFFAVFAVSFGILYGLRIFPLEPRTLVPLAGMTIGNSMTATTLAGKRIIAEFRDGRPQIEGALALGLRGSDAFKPMLRESLATALLPQLETTKAVGIVFLPGAMTGLILAGVPALDAVRVQAVVMFLVLGSVALSTTFVAVALSRRLFTPDQRLRTLR